MNIDDLVEYVQQDSCSPHAYGIIIAEEKKIWGGTDFTFYKVLWDNCGVFSCCRENIKVVK